jgi:hypothetical protein
VNGCYWHEQSLDHVASLLGDDIYFYRAAVSDTLYITAENRQDLVEAFEKTLGCPMMSAVPSSTAGAPLR